IGGQDTAGGGAAYAAFVDAHGKVYPIKGLPTGASAVINSVSMNEWGFALLGGTADGINAYAALVNPFEGLTVLDGLTGPPILSVSIRSFIPAPHLTRPHLTGNNLTFAKYILQFAPRKALYFSPSLFNGTLGDALESAAPTRNALSVFAADNNLFFLNQGLSSHLRHRRELRSPLFHLERQEAAFEEDLDEEQWLSFEEDLDEEWEDELLATADEEQWLSSPIALEQQSGLREAVQEGAPRQADRPYTLWGEVLGAWASQKAQNQTVGFDPSVGGFILALERTFHQNTQAGVGFSYLFTHVHEDKDAGLSNINQECLFLYGSWSYRGFYLDAAVWGGLFQTDQERKIHMTGFDFTSASHPGGGQFDPHLEVGYALMSQRRADRKWEFMLDPFIMADWVNTWQESYKEKGKGPFNAGQKSHYSSFLRAEAGVRFYEGIRFDAWLLGFEQKGSYVYKNPFSVGTVKSFLV
ncbi:MAG: autotransporter outer membrane beta-barrel domain-containing protein, partial [Chlamydiales bacterium]|nr:autotransporter outer membrane beta-barrel domain-containing protein [Chlamydiales bacterium]